jgi:putative polyketide hydroxylase
MSSRRAIDVPVLIVGAGPSGLCASILLSRHGIESLLVEKHPGTSIYPRATGINVRSMEIFRSLGLQEDVRRASFKAEPRIAFSRVLADEEPRVSPSFHPSHFDASPELWTSCSQKELEPILHRAAASYRRAQLLFGTQLVGFEETSEGIIAQIGDRATREVREVRCQYLIAADGSKSPIRERLGLRMLGPGVLNHNISIHFSAPLVQHLPHMPNFLHFVQNESVTGMFVATDGKSRWAFAVPYDPEHGESSDSITRERAVELVRQGTGIPGLGVDVLGIVPWRMEADSAERWRVGNVFLAGDAAHRMTPAGGLGMNTAIQDVHNLCWKLAAVLQGWAGPALLDTYEVERRPVAQQNLDRSVGLITGSGNVNERSALDIDLGSTYASTAVVPDGSAPPQRTDGEYEAVARPGARAPHVWLTGGQGTVSTLDLFGSHFTFLAGFRAERWRVAAGEIAGELSVPVLDRTAACIHASQRDGENWAAAYGVGETGAVLIRPDGHVAWRRAAAVQSPAKELCHVLNIILSRRPHSFRDVPAAQRPSNLRAPSTASCPARTPG